MSFNTDVYIAFQLQERSIPDDEGWVRSGFSYQNSDVAGTGNDNNAHATLPTNDANNYPEAPKIREAYSKARTWEAQVTCEYAGINSSGGPQVAGRASHADVILTRDCDLISPYLFQYCASGWQIQNIYVIRYIASDTVSHNFCHEWHLSGVHVTDYKYSNGRYYNECLDRTSLSARETVSLLYTTAKYRSSKFTGAGTLQSELGEWKGWDTSNNTGIGMPG
jgi:type VI protein secretion system component Hcp